MKVFVSSTSRDLAEYRTAAIRALRRLGHDVLAMEFFNAGRPFPLDHVVKLVRESDAYLVIVAWRYGFVPQIDDRSGDLRLPPAGGRFGISITEWEYLAALEDPNRLILPFLLDETVKWEGTEIDGVGPGSTVDSIRAFRATLTREHIVSFFDRPEDLEAKVGTAIVAARVSRVVRQNEVEVGSPVSSRTLEPDSVFENVLRLLLDAREIQAATIDLATSWWSTRLFLLAVLLDWFTPISHLLVVDGEEFVALLRPARVISELSKIHPQLAGLAHRRYERIAQVSVSDQAAAVIAQFRAEFLTQQAADSEPRGVQDSRTVQFAEGAREAERHVMMPVTRAAMTWWFDELLTVRALRITSIDRPRLQDLRQILEYPEDLVPVVTGRRARTHRVGDDRASTNESVLEVPRSHKTLCLVNRVALSHQLARIYITSLGDELTR